MDAELRFADDKHAQKYDYDDHYHIIEEISTLPNQYVYDSHHNRLASDDGDYEVDNLNQVLSSPDTVFAYDANGNPTKRGTATYKYDALDRLIEIIDESGTHSYSYDYQHRRIQSNDPSGLKRYIFDGQNEIGSISQDGTLLDRRILGVGQGAEIGASVLIENHDSQYIPLHDLYGNLSALLEDQDSLVSTSYDAFGKSNLALTDSPWRYSSKRVDSTGLVFFGRRYYNPELGRFLTPDPLGLSEGPNLYHYLQGCPFIGFDEYGLRTIITGMHTVDPIKMHAGASMCADISAACQSLWAWDRSIFNDRRQSSYDIYSAYIQQIFPLDLSSPKIQNQIGLQKTINHLILGGLTTTYFGVAIFNSLSIQTATNELVLSPDQTLPGLARFGMTTSSASQSAALTIGISSQICLNSNLKPGWVLPEKGGAVINGKWYTQHALERMAPKGLLQQGTEIVSRGVPPSVVENAIEFGSISLGNTADELIYTFENVRVVTNADTTRIITVITTGK